MGVLKNTRKSCTIGKVFGQILWLDKFIDKNERGAAVELLNDPLAYIMAGVKDPLRKSLTEALFMELAVTGPGTEEKFMDLIGSAAKLMIPLNEYDVTDFKPEEVLRSVQALKDKNPEAWAELLYALNLDECDGYCVLKTVSPFRNELLMFPTVDEDGRGIHMVPERDGSHYGGFASELPINPRPGNVCMLVFPEHLASQVRLIPIVNFPPATA